MVAGEWLCVYDIRINKPLVKESTHAGDATSVDWHPAQKYIIATGGGRDRSVKGMCIIYCMSSLMMIMDILILTTLSCCLQCGTWKAV